MSRPARGDSDGDVRFPRVSGDEPRLILVMTTKIVFSPRERG